MYFRLYYQYVQYILIYILDIYENHPETQT